MKSLRLTFFLVLSGILSAFAMAEDVEIVLKDRLNGDLNDYCLDIVGGFANIDPSSGLQIHTCYSYRGELGPDQGIDPEQAAEGRFYLSAFDVCATMEALDAGSKVALSSCDGGDLQQFDFAENGNISPIGAPAMCLTAGEETSLGRGGTSRHQIKSLTLQLCDDDLASYQQWFMRSLAEYNENQIN